MKNCVSARVSFLRRLSPIFGSLFALCIGLTPTVKADIKTWDGDGGGANWSTAGNWVGGVAPADGDALIFPAGEPNLNNTNNIAGLDLISITFSGAGGGYTLNGNAITLTTTDGINGEHTAGANTINFDITLTSAMTFSCVNAAVSLTINGDIALGANLLTVSATGDMTLGGAISGTGGLTKNGTGTLLFNGGTDNTYTGTTTVNAGIIECNRFHFNGITFVGDTSIPADLVVGSGSSGPDVVRLFFANQIANTSDITINAAGMLDLNGDSDTIGTLTFSSGGVVTNTGTGVLTLGGNVTATSFGSGTFPNAIIDGGLSLGASTRTFTVNSNVAGADLTVTATVSGTGGLIKTGAGTLSLTVSNSYSGATTVSAGILSIGNDFALGTVANGTTVDNGAALFATFGVNNIDEPLTISGDGPAAGGALQLEGALSWNTNIVLAANSIINCLPDAIYTATINGGISGTGNLTKIGLSTLEFSGSPGNTYAGDTMVNEGKLSLAKTTLFAIPQTHNLIIGDGIGGIDADEVEYGGNNMINSSSEIIINSSGLLDLNGFSDGLGTFRLVSGDITTAAGTLTMVGNLFATSSTLGGAATVSGNLALTSTRTFTVTNGNGTFDLVISAAVSGTGGITKTEAGRMSLTSSNSYTGTTTVNDGVLELEHDFALGTTAGGVTVNGDAVLQLNTGIHVGTEALTLNSTSTAGSLSGLFGSNSWAGAITLSTDTFVFVDPGDTLNLPGSISGAGTLTKIGTGTLIFSGASANTYTNTTTVNAGTLLLNKSVGDGAVHGPLIIGDGVGGVNADVVSLLGSFQLQDFGVPVTVNSSGLFDMNGIGDSMASLAGNGNLILGGGPGIGGDNTSTTFSGVISGSGGFTKTGSGTMTLSGDNTYTGATSVSAGKLVVDGSQPQSDVSVGASGTLGGSGTVGDINNVLGGIVAPGTSPGILTSSNVNFSGVSSDFTVEINGLSAGTDYDRLNVRGTNNLGGSTLNVSVGGGFAPTVGQILTIIANDGAEVVTGTFAGLPDNSILTSGIHKFRIDYANDVTLTYTNPALQIILPQVSAGNGNLSIDPNECNNLNLVITNTSGILMSGISAVLSSPTPGVLITQPESGYPNIAINGKGTNTTPFQISTLPTFNCSDPIDLTLVVTTASGNFVTLFSLPSGSEGAPVRFDNGSNVAIPDSGSVTSSVTVAGITTPIKKVTVSLHILHAADEDLDISLVAPDGTTINLSSDNGGTGDNYGSDCVDGSRTVFDDAAGTAITAGAVPYVGSFRPEQQLSAFIGKEGVDVNGTWKLIVTDDFAGGIGSLRCWSLFISPTACADGGGVCDTCPGTFTGSITTNDLVQTGRIFRDGVTKTCASPQPCPGPFDALSHHYDAYTFTNDSASAACVTVSLTSPAPSTNSVFAVAYLNTFNPASLCGNYLADIGNSVFSSNTLVCSFEVPAGNTFVVVVNEVDPNAGCTNYTLVVAGLECPPVLDIDPVPGNKVRLHWPTTAGGYLLESTDSLNPISFLPVPDQPIVLGGEYNVTNNVTGTNKFYQLIKP